MKVVIEEVLKAADISGTFAPFLIYSEVMEGARRPLAFLDVCREDFSLIGRDGAIIHVPTATQLTASEDTETNIATSGMGSADKTISSVSITATAIIYSAVELTDSLLEDYISLDLIRLHFRNMGYAVMEKLDANVEGVLAAGFGVLHTCATVNFVAISDALAAMEANSWIPDANNPPFCIVSPVAASTMVQDTKFVETPRFYGQAPDALAGEAGLYCGCRVLKTPLLAATGKNYIVFPPNYKFGPSVILAWKRRVRVKEDYYVNKEIHYYVTTLRAKSAVVQAYGVCRINCTTTP